MSHPDSLWTDKVWVALRIYAHRLIAWGYQDSFRRIVTTTDETAITGFISEAIENRLCDPYRPRWCAQLAVKEDTPVPGGGRTGRRRKRPDIIIQSTRSGHPEFNFEAKRLRKPGHKEDQYTGKDGLQCFLREEYAQRFDEGVMLGYIQSDTQEYWIEKIKSAIVADTKNKLDVKSPQRDHLIIDEFPNEWVSEHGRPSGRNILVYHILLDCHPHIIPPSIPLTVIDDHLLYEQKTMDL